MTNQEIISQAIKALLCMFLSLLIGFFVPIILAIAAYCITDITFKESILNVPFFLFSTLGTIIGAIYINQPKDEPIKL